VKATIGGTWWVAAAILAVGLVSAELSAQDTPAGGIAPVVDDLRRGGVVAGESIRAAPLVMSLYQERGFDPVWTRPGSPVELRRAIAGASVHGLDPMLYHLRAIDSLEALPVPGSRAAAELDVLRTSALVDLVRDLRWGRVRPVSLPVADAEADAILLRRIAGTAELAAAIESVTPDHFVYRGLAAALDRLRGIERDGGWMAIPAGRPLREGAFDARVLALRVRLASEGYLSPTLRPTDYFDAPLAEAVRSFQHHHGLNEDGIVGPTTLAELNVPVAARIAQVRVNLERARWLTPELPDPLLVVNIAGAKVYLLRDERVVHEARVIVGKDYTRTPTFSSGVRQIELNPTWTVPTSIVDEILSALRRDPGYLSSQGFRVLDRGGTEVEITASELLAGGSFPWTLRQDPGPLNPLGRIKFSFPNAYSVYLHDTPARALFEREERLFSHGCIRVQDPLLLAELLLDEPERWNRDSLQAAIDAGSTEAIPLRRAVSILVQYWTASADEHGELHFYRDVYHRDAAVLAGLGR
jgi:murein L,D-transpeptidase YcbB/YkuD